MRSELLYALPGRPLLASLLAVVYITKEASQRCCATGRCLSALNLQLSPGCPQVQVVAEKVDLMSRRSAVVLVTLLAVLAAAPRARVWAAANDIAALLELKAAVVGSPTSDSLANWTSGSDPCSAAEPWAGVTCSAGRVTEV